MMRGLLFVYIAALSCLHAMILDIPLEDPAYRIERIGGYDRVVLNQVALKRLT